MIPSRYRGASSSVGARLHQFEIAELFDVAFPAWSVEEARPSSCLKSQLGANYSDTFKSLRRRVIDFHAADRTSGEASVNSETALSLVSPLDASGIVKFPE